MNFYTGNYSSTNDNFIIKNLPEEIDFNNSYYSFIALVKNIISRGRPSIMSKFLQDKLDVKLNLRDKDSLNQWFKDFTPLISREKPIWDNTIRGNKEGYNPALKFFNSIGRFIPDYAFIEKLILPEARLKDILTIDHPFDREEVDFYLPQANLVIEIDGSQHQDEDQRLKDEERDHFLALNQIKVVRIPVKDFEEENENFYLQIDLIKKQLESNYEKLKAYKKIYDKTSYNELEKKKIQATEVFRNQILILELLERSLIKLNDDSWNLSITGNLFEDSLELAIQDLFYWFKLFCQLGKFSFTEPRLNIKHFSTRKDLALEDGIKIDADLRQRWSEKEMTDSDIIFIRTDYLDKKNYFKMTLAPEIDYKIIKYGENNDIACLEEILENIFGFPKFRPGQLDIIINILEGRDTVGLLPTGSGKSLCYQLAGLLQPSLTIVIVPIKSLMYDQEENLEKLYINHTSSISSDYSGEERQKIINNFDNGAYNFIWVSPERFQSEDFRDTLKNQDFIGLAVIDEVHCLSEWGHDFRTSYLNLIGSIKRFSDNVKILGLTATASNFVLEDLKREFNIDRDNIKTVEKYSRDELNFYVRKASSEDSFENLSSELLKEIDFKLNFSKDYSNSVLAFTKNVSGNKGCNYLAKRAKDNLGIEAYFYSGSKPFKYKLPKEYSNFEDYKFQIQKGFKNNEFPLLFATKAFGMGIDKPNIRSTIHFGLPSSLEALYQEAGRAGRDGKESSCYVIFQEDNWLDPKDEDILFANTSTTKDIKEVFDKYKKERNRQGDILSNFYFYLNGTKGIDHDLKIMREVFDKFAHSQAVETISRREIKSAKNLEELQKAVYRLKILGIVKDWTVSKWELSSKTSGQLRVYFADYTEKSVEKNIESYIKRYEPDFNYKQAIENNSGLKNIGRKPYEYMEFLLFWTYDNILYNRRKSIENIVNICRNFTDSKSFKKQIDSYFSFSQTSYDLEDLAKNPNEVRQWFNIFIRDKSFINKDELLELNASLSRMLESYRYNKALNFIYGLTEFFLKDGYLSNNNGKNLRHIFIEADEKDKEVLLNRTIELIQMSNIKDPSSLTNIMCKTCPESSDFIYENLKDQASLSFCLDKSTTKLKDIRRRLNG